MFLKILQIKGEKKLREVVTVSEKYLFVSYKESYSLAKPVRVTYIVGKCVTIKTLAVAHGKGDSIVRASKETASDEIHNVSLLNDAPSNRISRINVTNSSSILPGLRDVKVCNSAR